MSKYAARVAAVKVSKERMYDIIRFPIITEKAKKKKNKTKDKKLEQENERMMKKEKEAY